MTGLATLTIVGGNATVWAHARPQTTDPQPNARLDAAPARIAIAYDVPIDAAVSPIVLLDAVGQSVPSTTEPASNNRLVSISPLVALTPGPFTVSWTSVDPEDGHPSQGFYTFVVNGGPTGIINGLGQAQAAAADMWATLTVTRAADGGSLLRVDLDNTTGVERVRIRLTRADVGESLLETQPSGDGGWVLDGNQVALPGAWQALVIVRRFNIFDDAQAPFDFIIDAATGEPSFPLGGAAHSYQPF